MKSASSGIHQSADSGPSTVGEIVGTIALTVYSITASLAFAALIFTGPAADGLPRGTATFLLASGLITMLLGWRTCFPIAFGVVQDTAAIVLVPVIAVVVAEGSDAPVRDTFVVLALSSLITGAVMWSIGRAGLAGASRFMPTTVLAGFLAGTGWLLAKGGVDVMTDRSLGLGDLGDVVGFDLAQFWLPGAALGVAIAVLPMINRVPPLVASAATVGSTALFFLIVTTSSSLSAVEEGGWLLGPFPDGGEVSFVASDLAEADWSAVTSASGQIGVVVILSVLGALLNISGLQVLLHTRIDLDAELRTIGAANVATAAVGGLVGYHGLGDTSLAQRLGVRRRWVPIVVGAATTVSAFAGIGLLGYLPKFVAGGLLIGAGLGLLIGWIRELRATSSWSDRAVSIMILATMCFVGILEGIVVGIVAACVFFVIRYSRIDAIRIVSTGQQRRSVVERSPEETNELDQRADRLAVYELHGSLFFGSVSSVAATIRERLARAASPVDIVIVDFARVADIDSSAFAALAELAEDVDTADARLIWSSLDAASIAVLRRLSGRDAEPVAENLDAALELAEDQILAVIERSSPAEPQPNPYPDALLDWFETRHHPAGDVLMVEGDDSDELFVVVVGSVHVSQLDHAGREMRLRTLRAGAIVGEIGFLTGHVRTATVTAETDVELRVLTSASNQRLRQDQPQLVIELYDHVLRGTAGRAAEINKSLKQALR